MNAVTIAPTSAGAVRQPAVLEVGPTGDKCIGEPNCQAAIVSGASCIYKKGDKCMDPVWARKFNLKFANVEVRK